MSDHKNTLDFSIPFADIQRIREQQEQIDRITTLWFEINTLTLNPAQHDGKNLVLKLKEFFTGLQAVKVDTAKEKLVIQQYAQRLSKIRAFEAFARIRQNMLAEARELVRRLEADTETPGVHNFPKLDELQQVFSREDAQHIEDTLVKQIDSEIQQHIKRLDIE